MGKVPHLHDLAVTLGERERFGALTMYLGGGFG
jgi:hypothetical protein